MYFGSTVRTAGIVEGVYVYVKYPRVDIIKVSMINPNQIVTLCPETNPRLVFPVPGISPPATTLSSPLFQDLSYPIEPVRNPRTSGAIPTKGLTEDIANSIPNSWTVGLKARLGCRVHFLKPLLAVSNRLFPCFES